MKWSGDRRRQKTNPQPLAHLAYIRYTPCMKTHLSVVILFSLMFSGCVTIPQESLRVRYDDRRDLYIVDSGEKKGTVLRDEQANIIREVSDKDKLIKQYNEDPEILSRLPLKIEYASMFVRQDYTITSLYFSGVKELNRGNYENSLEFLEKAVKKYPDIIRYSDISFLMGYCYEQLGDPEKAEEHFNQFIQKSEKKYSARFNEIDQISPDLYRDQLEYARNFINQELAEFDKTFTENETVKYFNNNRYPGFVVGLRPGFSSLGVTILPNLVKIEESYIYVGMSYTFNRWLDVGGAIGFPTPFECGLSADIQLFKTKNRQFGISLESMFFYAYREEIVEDYSIIELDPPLHYFNTGLKCGTGIYLLPDLYLGGYYVYYLYNQNNKFRFESSGISLTTWNLNSYRVSLRYLPFKIADLDLSYWNDEIYFGTNVYLYTYTLYIGYAVLENKFVMRLNSMDLID